MRPKGAPEQVLVHDFLIPDLGRVPYGVYDIAQNEAWVSVGTDHDTAAFAVEHPALVARHGAGALPERHSAADNGRRGRQQWVSAPLGSWSSDSDETGLVPPPTRDQQVEQDRTPLVLRDQSELARKAAGQPLVNLIGATTTRTGPVQSQLQPIPGRATVSDDAEAIYLRRTLSMVNGIIRCYPALRCSIELIIS